MAWKESAWSSFFFFNLLSSRSKIPQCLDYSTGTAMPQIPVWVWRGQWLRKMNNVQHLSKSQPHLPMVDPWLRGELILYSFCFHIIQFYIWYIKHTDWVSHHLVSNPLRVGREFLFYKGRMSFWKSVCFFVQQRGRTHYDYAQCCDSSCAFA